MAKFAACYATYYFHFGHLQYRHHGPEDKNRTIQNYGKENDPSIDYKQVGAPMPDLLYVPYYDSTANMKHKKNIMTNRDLENDANLIVMMFNPTCSHCQDQTIVFEKNEALFKRSKLLLLSTMIQRRYLPNFAADTHADQYSFMYLGSDSTEFINNLFMYQALPQINIYSADRKLLKSYCGEVL